jgi:hypothetical protein
MMASTSDAEFGSKVGEQGSEAQAGTVNGFGLKGNCQPLGGKFASAYCPGVAVGAGRAGVFEGVRLGARDETAVGCGTGGTPVVPESDAVPEEPPPLHAVVTRIVVARARLRRFRHAVTVLRAKIPRIMGLLAFSGD